MRGVPRDCGSPWGVPPLIPSLPGERLLHIGQELAEVYTQYVGGEPVA